MLSWQTQIHELCVRANAKLAVLRSVKYLSRSTLDILYKLQIRSLIDYGLVIYYHQLKQTEVARLDQIQYKAGKLAYIRHEDFFRPSYSVTLVLPPLISEMGWTGELWSNCVLLILEN